MIEFEGLLVNLDGPEEGAKKWLVLKGLNI